MKAYVKPELFYERYELSQHIATCGIDVRISTEETCAMLDEEHWPGLGGMQVFNSECAMNTDSIEVYCYTTGTDVQGRLFNS